MSAQIKAIILGLTNSGKSSVAELLKKRGWPIVEVDDEAQARNGGIWPESEDVLDVLFKEINEEVLKSDNIVFVTSFLEIIDTKRFIESGFTIIELRASYKELQRRKIQRDGYPQDEWERFNRNYENFQKYLPQVSEHISLSLDSTNKKSEDLADEIEQALTSK
jgi:broad-specificity NMP kinase